MIDFASIAEALGDAEGLDAQLEAEGLKSRDAPILMDEMLSRLKDAREYIDEAINKVNKVRRSNA